MKKYKIGNKLITADSPVKALEIYKIVDSKCKDGWSGSYMGAIYAYDSAKDEFTITLPEGKTEKIPGSEVNSIVDLQEKISKLVRGIKDSIRR